MLQQIRTVMAHITIACAQSDHGLSFLRKRIADSEVSKVKKKPLKEKLNQPTHFS